MNAERQVHFVAIGMSTICLKTFPINTTITVGNSSPMILQSKCTIYMYCNPFAPFQTCFFVAHYQIFVLQLLFRMKAVINRVWLSVSGEEGCTSVKSVGLCGGYFSHLMTWELEIHVPSLSTRIDQAWDRTLKHLLRMPRV